MIVYQALKSDTKMFKNDLFNRNGLLLLYFKRKLPEPFSREKMPKASIIVSLTWKLRFISNSISRSGSGLESGPPRISDKNVKVLRMHKEATLRKF